MAGGSMPLPAVRFLGAAKESEAERPRLLGRSAVEKDTLPRVPWLPRPAD
jgi:hypothetical protein